MNNMAITTTNDPTSRKPLRLWPGVALAILLVLLRFAVPLVVLEAMPIGMIGALVCGMAIVVAWWLFFSRAPWSERLGVIFLMIVAVFITSRLVHASIAGGAMGALLYVWAVPTLGLALVVAAAASRGHSAGARRGLLVTAILLACGVWPSYAPTASPATLSDPTSIGGGRQPPSSGCWRNGPTSRSLLRVANRHRRPHLQLQRRQRLRRPHPRPSLAASLPRSPRLRRHQRPNRPRRPPRAGGVSGESRGP